MPKILYVITKSNWGGAQTYVYNMATNMVDFEVVVALGGDGELKRKLEEKGIKTIQINKLGRNINFFGDLYVFFKLISIFRRERPDIIHLNSSKIGGVGSLAGRLTGIKNIIFTAHGWAFKEDRFFISKLIIKFFSWLTVLFSHKIIVLSKYERSITPGNKDKVKIIYNGVKDIDFLDRETAREKFPNIPTDKKWIGVIAELHKNKGLKYLAKALPENYSLIIIGEGEEKIKGSNIYLVGNIPEAYKYLKAFDIFVLPSVKEGLPYTIIEAGLAELPVLSTTVGGIPEIITQDSGILVQPKNTEELRKNIPLLKIEHGINLRKRILENFTFEEMLEKTKRLYS